VVGANTYTPTNTVTSTPTFVIAAPVFEHNYGTTGAVNGMVITGALMTLAESQTSPQVGVVESFAISPGGTANTAFPGVQNAILQGFPPQNPAPTPAFNPLLPWTPLIVGLNGPQGYVNPGGNGGYSAILDNQPNGGAILYYGNSSTAGWNAAFYNLGWDYEPFNVGGYNFFDVNPPGPTGDASAPGGDGFWGPKSMTADLTGNIYIADTGNGRIMQFTGTAPLHLWTGNAGNTFANGFTSVTFKSPYAVALDNAVVPNVWVGDNGYSPAVVQSFSSGGTTITGGFTLPPGCVVHGIAVAPVGATNTGAQNIGGYIYVADAGNNQVEIFAPGPVPPLGTLVSILTSPHSVSEGGAAFSPSCIGFFINPPATLADLWVADTTNAFIESFH